MAGLDERAAAIELVQVEQEVDLDVSFLAGELAQAKGEGAGVERGGDERGHGAHSGAAPFVTCVFRASGHAPGARLSGFPHGLLGDALRRSNACSAAERERMNGLPALLRKAERNLREEASSTIVLLSHAPQLGRIAHARGAFGCTTAGDSRHP